MTHKQIFLIMCIIVCAAGCSFKASKALFDAPTVHAEGENVEFSTNPKQWEEFSIERELKPASE